MSTAAPSPRSPASRCRPHRAAQARPLDHPGLRAARLDRRPGRPAPHRRQAPVGSTTRCCVTSRTTGPPPTGTAPQRAAEPGGCAGRRLPVAGRRPARAAYRSSTRSRSLRRLTRAERHVVRGHPSHLPTPRPGKDSRYGPTPSATTSSSPNSPPTRPAPTCHGQPAGTTDSIQAVVDVIRAGQQRLRRSPAALHRPLRATTDRWPAVLDVALHTVGPPPAAYRPSAHSRTDPYRWIDLSADAIPVRVIPSPVPSSRRWSIVRSSRTRQQGLRPRRLADRGSRWA